MANNKQQHKIPISSIPTGLSYNLRVPSYITLSLLAVGLVILLWEQHSEIVLSLWLLSIISLQLLNFLLDKQRLWQSHPELLLVILQLIIWALLPIFFWSEILAIQIVQLFFLLLVAMLIHLRFSRMQFSVVTLSILMVPLLRFITEANSLRLLTILLLISYVIVWYWFEKSLFNHRKYTDSIDELEGDKYGTPLQNDFTVDQKLTNDSSGASLNDLEKHILIVEDNLINQQVVAEMLQALKVRISIADNGEQALEMLYAEPFDLVLMDIQMPHMDGYEVTERIRQLEQFKDLPIIAMTAYAMREDRTRCLAAGMNDHISKPFEPDHFYQTLEKWLDLIIDDKDELLEPVSNFTPVDSDFDNLAGIEAQIGLRKVINNQALYHKLLMEFFQDFKNSLIELKKYTNTRQFDSACRILHRFKGASGNIGANRLYQTSSDLEQQIKQQQSYDLDEFEYSFKQVMDGLAGLKNPPVVASEAVGSIDYRIIKPLLRELSQYLQEANPQAVELLPKIKLAAQGNFTELLKVLMENVYTFQFEEAEITLKQINHKLNHMENRVDGQ